MNPDEPVVVHRVPDEISGVLLRGVLESQGIPAILRSAQVAGYGLSLKRDWTTIAWGELLVAAGQAEEARGILAEYLAALRQGGEVTDADVTGTSDPDA